MCTVYSAFTVGDMRRYFQQHGSGRLFIRENPAAADLWMKELELQSSCLDDCQILRLIRKMCAIDPSNRPGATQLVSEILDFKGNLYYDYCCDRSETTRSSGRDGDIATCDFTTLSSLPEVEPPPVPRGEPPTSRPLSYQSPSVEEAMDNPAISLVSENVVKPASLSQHPGAACELTPTLKSKMKSPGDMNTPELFSSSQSTFDPATRPWNR